MPTATETAWKTAYQGPTARMLVDTIFDEYLGEYDEITNRRNWKWRHVENFLTITQSTGTGKSRMVHEAGAALFLIPVNLHRFTSESYALRLCWECPRSLTMPVQPPDTPRPTTP